MQLETFLHTILGRGSPLASHGNITEFPDNI